MVVGIGQMDSAKRKRHKEIGMARLGRRRLGGGGKVGMKMDEAVMVVEGGEVVWGGRGREVGGGHRERLGGGGGSSFIQNA